MQNEILFILFLLINFSFVVLAFKLFGRAGLYAMIGMSILFANIQVLKLVDLFGFVATLGNIVYGSIFLATDILNEKYGRKEAQKSVWAGFLVAIAATIFAQLTIYYIPHAEDFIQPHLVEIFSLIPRIAFGSLIAYLISQSIDVYIFDKLKKKFKTKKLWLRNNVSTLASQALDTLVFTMIAFWGLYSGEVLMSILITTYVFKCIVSILDTPFMYIAKRISAK